MAVNAFLVNKIVYASFVCLAVKWSGVLVVCFLKLFMALCNQRAFGGKAMLIIRFFNENQRYIYETIPFSNGSIKEYQRLAFSLADNRKDIAGWIIFECIGGEWFPYRPFNRCIRYDKSRKLNT